MSRHTSFCLGGRADLWAEPESAEDLRFLLGFLDAEGIPLVIFGNGTNFLVGDGGVRGAVVSMKRFRGLSFAGRTVSAGAGVSLARILNQAIGKGLSGFEFAAGIPASAGGAAASNAGGKFGDMKGVLKSVVLLSGGGVEKAGIGELGMGYRKSGIEDGKKVIISAEIELSEGDPGMIKKKAREVLEYKRKAQPLGSRSAGCVFKNPGGMSAGVMISSIGLSGRRIGGAEISVKHANYIINRGRATSGDVLSLIQLVEEEVLKFYNIKLEREVKIIGR